ncbi:hypothetical protein AKJ60_00820 [candidate division MSBL1 archaeon SCGC-AAA385M11]|nr:hypothetical protein AKJ60_00820 [candidate division MSBL1 archaeon SCGC-AAA385M11]
MSNGTGTPHDNVVKNILGREEVARDFVRYYLPEEISKDLDLETLEVSTQSFVSNQLKESLSDLVISLQLQNGEPAEIYLLIEHKSGLEKWTKLQLFNYLNQKWQKIAEEDKENLPIIIPLVFYHGKKRWKYSLEFSDLFNPPDEYYRKYIPKFQHILHEVPEINQRQVKSTITLEVFHLVLEYIFYPEKRDKIYESFELLFQGLDSKNAGEIFAVLIKYLLMATDEETEEAAQKVKHLPQGEETVRTTAEVLRKEGEERGIHIGEERGEQRGRLKESQENLIEFLQDEFGVVNQFIVDKIISINSREVVKGLSKQARKVNTLEEFTQELNKVL